MQTKKNLDYKNEAYKNTVQCRSRSAGVWKNSALLCFALVLVLLSVSCPMARVGRLVWSDEFNGASVDRSNWVFETGNGQAQGIPGWGNNELQFYRSENASIQDLPGGGRGLAIETRRESASDSTGTYNYTSARMKTQGLHQWTYGRFEARIRLPEGQGLWPAFWMLGANITEVPWPVSGEIDIMEYRGNEPNRAQGTLHVGVPGHRFEHRTYTLPSGNFSDGFHIFAIEWERGQIRWYVDDTLYFTQRIWTSSLGPFPAPFDRDFFLLLNVAVGGNFLPDPIESEPFPSQRMYVDYVRVYELVN